MSTGYNIGDRVSFQTNLGSDRGVIIDYSYQGGRQYKVRTDSGNELWIYESQITGWG
jgi:hypothetical protein